MTRVDLHPEDLFDHLRRGELRDDERERLQRHCAVCSACAFELQVMEGDAYESEPTADDQVIAARALERMLSSDAGQDVVAAPVIARGQLLWRAAALVLAGVLVGGSVSAAALANSDTAGWVTWIGSWVAWSETSSSTPKQMSEDAKAKATPTSRASTRSPRVTDAPTPVEASAVSEPVAIVTPVAPVAPMEAVAPVAPLEVVEAPAPRQSHLPPRARVAAQVVATPQVEPAAWLFRAASRARAEGRVHEAAALYDALQRDYADSEVEIVTRVALGRLALSQLNDPGRALFAFDSYLLTRPNGALAEEARSGRVLALRKLGRDEEAQAAAQELSQLHPRTLYTEMESEAP